MEGVGAPLGQRLEDAPKGAEAARLQRSLGDPAAAHWAAEKVVSGGPLDLPGRA